MNEHPLNVVFVDDNPADVAGYVDRLRRANYGVTAISDPGTAFKYIENPIHEPDIWVLDMMMVIGPDPVTSNGVDITESLNLGLESGLALYKQIKRLHPDTPVIIFTGVPRSFLPRIEEEVREHGDTLKPKSKTAPKQLLQHVDLRLANI